jgi:hypothetical protein
MRHSKSITNHHKEKAMSLLTVFDYEDGFRIFFTDSEEENFKPSSEELEKADLAANEICDYLNKRFKTECYATSKADEDGVWVSTEGLFDDETAYLWGCEVDAEKLMEKHDINWES